MASSMASTARVSFLRMGTAAIWLATAAALPSMSEPLHLWSPAALTAEPDDVVDDSIGRILAEQGSGDNSSSGGGNAPSGGDDDDDNDATLSAGGAVGIGMFGMAIVAAMLFVAIRLQPIVSLEYRPATGSVALKFTSPGELRETELETSPSMAPIDRMQRGDNMRGDAEALAGRVGLVNLGNTCFMNAALQCLSHTQLLTKHFLSDEWRVDLNKTNALGSGGELAEAYAELMHRLWRGKMASFPPTNFKQVVSRFAPQFEGYEQQDAQELAVFLLDGLHEDLNRVQKKPYVEDVEVSTVDAEGNVTTRDEEVVAAEAWGNYLKRDRSVIVDQFQGQLKSTIRCKSCGYETAKFDPFMYLTLPLPDAAGAGGELQLEECLQAYMAAEELSEDNMWRCPKCKDFRAATKSFELWKVPHQLVLVLKRFKIDGRGRQTKRRECVQAPLEGLDLASFVGGAPFVSPHEPRNNRSSSVSFAPPPGYPPPAAAPAPSCGGASSSSTRQSKGGEEAGGSSGAAPAPSSDADAAAAAAAMAAPLSTRYGGKLPKYHLYAACNHHGTMHSGHYTATARHHEDGMWYTYNDKRCSPTEPQHVVNADNYILFFEQRKGIGPRRQTLSAPEDWPFALGVIPAAFKRTSSALASISKLVSPRAQPPAGDAGGGGGMSMLTRIGSALSPRRPEATSVSSRKSTESPAEDEAAANDSQAKRGGEMAALTESSTSAKGGDTSEGVSVAPLPPTKLPNMGETEMV